jgi:hypothetical protein
MTSLYRTAQLSQEPLKISTTVFGVKHLNIRHRNYSSSRLNSYQPLDLLTVKQIIDNKKQNDQTKSTNHSK